MGVVFLCLKVPPGSVDSVFIRAFIQACKEKTAVRTLIHSTEKLTFDG